MIKNTKPNIKKFSLLKPKNVIFISVILILIIIISTIFEYNSNKNDIYHMLGEYANSMIHVISKSSENSIISDSEMENLLAEHLLGVAKNVSRLDSLKLINSNTLNQIANENEIYRINIFNQNKERIFSNAELGTNHLSQKGKYSPDDYLSPLYEGKENEIIIGLKEARLEKGTRFAVAIRRTENKGVIVVNLDAESYLNFKNKIGFGKLILDIGAGTGIKYVSLQNKEEILAANINVDELTNLNNDEELKKVYESGNTFSRIIKFNNENIFETISLFSIDNKKIGIFRVGLSMDEIHSMESKMLTRTILVSLLIVVITIIVLSFIISNQNYNLISEEYKRIQTFSGNILENLSLALITIDTENNIFIFNRSAYEILLIPFSETMQINIDSIRNISNDIYQLLISKKALKNYEIETEIKGNKKTFMLNSTALEKADSKIDTYSLLIEDITEIRKISKQLIQNDKFTAMGELASGVAHEIRNPLNTIYMISQRLDREYKNKLKSEDFNSLTDILHSESQRVNSIIEQFLRFTKPLKLAKQKIKISELLDDIIKIISIQAEAKNIIVNTIIETDAEVNIDYQQMKQVFLNLFRNSIEATNQGGKIGIRFYKSESKFIFEIYDTGCGISEENLKKIFDIYFTTKPTGTGMGLSIVRQIILQHGGTIDVESNIDKGTKFIITLQ